MPKQVDRKAACDAVLARCPLPLESRVVDTRYGQTHILASGAPDAPPLFVFHGWIGNASGMWKARVLGFLDEG